MSGTSEYRHTNRLIHETSPYLQQHAHNPVDWYPWGEEALLKAQREDKPIMLSVGYSACHWCHVMERESFENEQIADLMNQHFVSIKVDREERPDIDAIYMQAVQAMTGQGGWPMTVFLTPDGRPFYGGTYYPPNDRHYTGGQMMPGFPRVLLSMAEAYQNHRHEIEEQANQLAAYLKQRNVGAQFIAPTSHLAPTPIPSADATQLAASLASLLNTARKALSDEFDAEHGGFGGAPKFPNTMSLELLLRIHLHLRSSVLGGLPGEGTQFIAQDETANVGTQFIASPESPELDMIDTSLQGMANGGIYDQLGGGFHRYSVDARWLVPHFEKMLYDNALLSRLYLHAYLVTGNPMYRRVVEETLDYVLREMTSPDGGFYSTQDADSEGEEGKFFLWTQAEIEAALLPEDARLFMRYYGVSSQGNFEGKNILHVVEDAETLAGDMETNLEAAQESLARSRAMLFKVRQQRVRPGRDEKILTAWNGLMLHSFAEAARYLDRPDYLQVALNNASFLLNKLQQDGRLLRTYKEGRAHLKGYLEDYVFLAGGLLALYEAGFDPRWFAEARRLADEVITLFADDQNSGFFDTGADHETLIARPRDIMDNAVPAGNSVAAEVLLRLAAFTGEDSYRQRADDYLNSLAHIMAQAPQAFGHALGALDFALSPVKEIAIIGDPHAADTRALLEVANRLYRPNSVLACASPDDTAAQQAVPLLSDRPLKDGKAAAYVCQHFVCLAPVNTPDGLEPLLQAA